MALPGVRSKAGVPVAADFASPAGTPWVINTSNGFPYLYISSTVTLIGGTYRATPGTTDSTTYNIVGGHPNNSIEGGDANTIAGGGNAVSTNRMTGSIAYRTISGGYDNLIGTAITSTIGGGSHNKIYDSTSHCFIGGGSFNETQVGDSCTVAGGSANVVNGTQGTICGGVNNTCGATSFIGGGSTNSIACQWATIGGGITNTISSSGPSSTIAGGNGIALTNGAFVSIGGGYQHALGTASKSCLGATIAGGYQNKIAQTQQAQYAAIAGGNLNSIDADYGGVPYGYSNSVTAAFGGASGIQAVAYLRGQRALSAGEFASVGDCQISDLVAGKITTNATPALLALDNASATITLRNNTVWKFRIDVVATRTDVIGEYAAYEFTGLIKRDSGATTVSGLVSTVIFETTAAWACAVTAGASSDLAITATGEAAKTIRWVARISLAEVASA